MAGEQKQQPAARLPRPGDWWSLTLKGRWTHDYPAEARVEVAVSWEPSSLNLRFDVDEEQTRAMETDPWLVHRDSCVEIFFQLPGSDEYFNLEVNPVGLYLFAVGAGRNGRRDLTANPGQLISIDGSHAGKPAFDRSSEPWFLVVGIPPEAVGSAAWGSHLDGMKMNIYKCGDALALPHYQSWAPLSSAEPDFHRKNDFGSVKFDSLESQRCDGKNR